MMKVEVKNDNTVLLSSIDAGECFTYGKDFYIRVTKGGNLSNGEIITAVNLNSGSLCAFTLLCRIVHMKLKIVNDD